MKLALIKFALMSGETLAHKFLVKSQEKLTHKLLTLGLRYTLCYNNQYTGSKNYCQG